MVRLARAPDGTVRFGRTLPGRGAWLCADINCLELALRRRAIGRALRCDVGPDVADALRSGFPAATAGARDYEAPVRQGRDDED